MDEKKNLQDNGYTSATARAQAPAQIGLACRQNGKTLFTLSVWYLTIVFSQSA